MRQCGKNVLELDRPEMKIWRMRIACCMTTATDRHLYYVIRVFIAFPQQQWLH